MAASAESNRALALWWLREIDDWVDNYPNVSIMVFERDGIARFVIEGRVD